MSMPPDYFKKYFVCQFEIYFDLLWSWTFENRPMGFNCNFVCLAGETLVVSLPLSTVMTNRFPRYPREHYSLEVYTL